MSSSTPVLIELDQRHLAKMLVIEGLSQEQPWNEKAFSDCLTDRYLNIGLSDQNQLVGFLMLCQVLDEAQILNFAVHPNHRGQGLGRSLLESALHRLSQLACSSVCLEVRVSNIMAQGLYLSAGFDVIAKRKDYYKKHEGYEDALVMQKRIFIKSELS